MSDTDPQMSTAPARAAHLIAYYLSRDRILALIAVETLSARCCRHYKARMCQWRRLS